MALEYVGNCINCFDEDGNCIIAELPFDTVSDLACSLEESSEMSESEFLQNVSYECVINLGLQLGRSFEFYRTDDNVLVMYSNDDDIHYFFV